MPTARTGPPPRIYNDLINSLAERKRPSVQAQLLFFSPLGNLTFNFPFAPREIQYGSLANTYSTINRPGTYPILDRTAPQLMTVSMQFRVANRDSGGSFPIEKELDILRGMGLLPGRLLVTNMDAFLSKPTFPTVTWNGGKFAWFRLTDLSIDIVSRTLQNRARQANVSLTLTEDRNPWVPVVTLPPIDYSEEERAAPAAAAPAAAGVPPRAAISVTDTAQLGARERVRAAVAKYWDPVAKTWRV
jgi:hypothetical protein